MMKMNYFAAGVAAIFSSVACAEASSVVLYGIADVGVEYITNASGTDKSLFHMRSGNLSGSRFGLRVNEDLGSGAKAIATLEAGFNMGNGTSGQNNRLFGRQAFVGIASPAGSVTLGRQYSSIYDVMGNYDPMDYADYGVLSHDLGMMARVDKALKYTGKFDDVTVTGFYSFGRDKDMAPGEVPGDAKSGRQWGLGVNYDAGPFAFGVAYDSLNNPSPIDMMNGSVLADRKLNYNNSGSDKTARRIAVGTSYTLGSVKFFLGYRNLKTDFSAQTFVPPGMPVPPGIVPYLVNFDLGYKSNLYWGGVKWQATPETILTAAVHHSQNKTKGAGEVDYVSRPNVTSYVLAADYKLSKRTDIYTNLSYMKNRSQANGWGTNWGVNAGEQTMIAKSQTGLQVGLRHRF